MKRLLTYIFVIGGLTTATNAHAQAQEQPSERQGKQGFTLGILPALAYDTDLGFQYGLLTNLYWYGDGSRYPKYDHSLYLEASRFRAGTTLIRAYYDSPRLIKNYRTTIKGPCQSCEKKEECYGCRGAAFQMTGDYLASDPTCWRNSRDK